MSSKVKPDKIINIGTKWKGTPVVQYSFKGKFKKDILEKKVEALNKQFEELNFDGKLSVSIMYPEGWRSGPITNIGEKVLLFDPAYYGYDEIEDEPDTFPRFQIYLLKNATRKGGYDNHNDCLWNCLQKALKDDNPWKTPQKLKKYLGLKRDDRISIEYMKDIDRRFRSLSLSVQMNVIGDHIYTSTHGHPQEIKLRLREGHYEPNRENKLIVHGIAYKEKTPALFKFDDEIGKVAVCDDGRKIKYINKDTYSRHRKNPRSSPYVLIPVENFNPKKITLEKIMKTSYADFVKIADKLKEVSKGLINMYKTGTYKKTALALFDEFQKIIIPDPIEQDEAEWIDKAFHGALIWADKYKGEVYKYDFCSMYPSIMKDSKMLFPFKRGQFKQMTDKELSERPSISYGIYRCKIEKKEDSWKIFKYNKFDYYTNIDLKLANECNLKITFIMDDKPNALIYNRKCCILGSQLFGKYIDYLFPLKMKKIEGAKNLLNILWGGLCQRNNLTIKVRNDEEFDIRDDKDLVALYPANKNETILKLVNMDKLFDTNYARIGCFITAKGRYKLSNTIRPHVKDVVRVHTDSMFVKNKPDIETGNDIGQLKYEGYCPKAKIINCCKTQGEFVID